mmetsp:Transcript_18624/g.29212  ORF Transcript_18624/g.29212 Transcript_18624/m.29212 type:complete len:211 (-) Transcript_18624:67-699(-)
MTKSDENFVQYGLLNSQFLQLFDILRIGVTFPVVQVFIQYFKGTCRTSSLTFSSTEQLIFHRTNCHLGTPNSSAAIVEFNHLSNLSWQFKTHISISCWETLRTTHNVSRAKHIPTIGTEWLEEGGKVGQGHTGWQSCDVQQIIMTQEHFVGRDITCNQKPFTKFGLTKATSWPSPSIKDSLTFGPQHLNGTLSCHLDIIKNTLGLECIGD